MNYIESIYKYCKMADILEQARDFVQSDYGFILEGIEYATESEAREALAEMQA